MDEQLGIYEGPTSFDDLFTRVVDAMIEQDMVNYALDPRKTFIRCVRQAHAAFAVIHDAAS